MVDEDRQDDGQVALARRYLFAVLVVAISVAFAAYAAGVATATI